jgi:atypical dual specificity phosphatase
MKSPIYEFLVYMRSLIPAPLRYLLTLILFYPTTLKMRIEAWFYAGKHKRIWDRIYPTSLIVGQAPIFQSDIEKLYDEGVRSVINCCKEWNGNKAYYELKGIEQLYIPTIDFDIPAIEDMHKAHNFISMRLRELPNSLVYIHCKAGKGRSVCIALAHMILSENITADAAHERIIKARPHANDKRKAMINLRKGGISVNELFSAAIRRESGISSGAAASAIDAETGDITHSSIHRKNLSSTDITRQEGEESEVASLLPRPGGVTTQRAGSATRRRDK